MNTQKTGVPFLLEKFRFNGQRLDFSSSKEVLKDKLHSQSLITCEDNIRRKLETKLIVKRQ